jgi:hypothetical protein
MTGTPWNNQSNALKSFFNDPQSAGIAVAMSFFPIMDDPTGASCDGATYVSPLVDWGTLTGTGFGAAATLASAISKTQPNGGFTPTQDALTGVLKGARARQLALPNHLVSAVIVSDGSPNTCADNTPAGMGAIAASYYNGSPSVRTFAIYVASDATAVMTQIAANGGTGKPYDGISGTQAFLDAIKAIQAAVNQCDFAMPTSSLGTVDPDNVQLVFEVGTSTTIIPRIVTASQCTSDGWYYDNAANPTRIFVCPTTCSSAATEAGAKVKVDLGCLN